MSLVGKPLIGIVYKTFDTGKTYTHWYHTHSHAYGESPSMWLDERLGFEMHLRKKKIRSDRIMMIVRGK